MATHNLVSRFHFILLAVLTASATAAQAQSSRSGCSHGYTQLALNQCASDEFKEADRRLTSTYGKLLAAIPDSGRQSMLRSAQAAWMAFRDKQCGFEASAYEGGSMQPMQHAACLAVITRDRDKQLRELLAEERR